MQLTTDHDPARRPATAFQGDRVLHSGPLAEVALAVTSAADAGPGEPILVFDDATGRVVDLDLRGSEQEILERLERSGGSVRGADAAATHEVPGAGAAVTGTRPPQKRGPGRPRLGVVSREVTLLPRHWDWLASQPGGASATLRKLVEQARRSGGARDRRRAAQEAAYRFMLAMAGDRPGHEEATRALFAGDLAALEARMAAWPEDVRNHALRLARAETGAQDARGPSERPEEAS